MKKPVLIIAFLFNFAFAAYGQSHAPKDQFFFGYELQHAHLTALGVSSPSENLNGLTISNTVKLYRWLGAEGDFSTGYKSVGGTTVLNYYMLGGPRVSFAFGRFAPYGHFLLGADHLHTNDPYFGSDTAFALGGGGGASVYLTKHFGISGGIDYLHASKNGIGLNDLRVIAGPVFTFGGSRRTVAENRRTMPAASTSYLATQGETRSCACQPSALSTAATAQGQQNVARTVAPQPQVTCMQVQINPKGEAVCTEWKQTN